MKLLLLVCALWAQAKMVYLKQEGDSRVVVLAENDGSGGRVISPPGAQTYHPEISADGRFVAYSAGVIDPGKNVSVAIHVQDLSTGVVEVWTPAGDQYIHGEFSGDGRFLAFSMPVTREGKKSQNIALVDLPVERSRGPVKVKKINGIEHRFYQPRLTIIESPFRCYFPALASDGSFVVYHRTKNASVKEIVLRDLWRNKTTLLSALDGHAMVPSLSADNRHIAYAGISAGVWDIHLIDRWTKKIRQVTDSKEKEFTPVFAPDGSVAYSRIGEENGFEIDIYRLGRAQVFGEKDIHPTPLVAEPGVFEYAPSFSGDLSFSLKGLPDIPPPARSSFAAVKSGDDIFILGGHQGKGHTYPPESFLDRVDIFNTKTRRWRRGASMSVPRQGLQAAAHGGYIYAFGGFAFSPHHTPGWRSLDIVERYDIAADRWETLLARLPRKRSSNEIARVGDRVYLIGGWDSTPRHKDDIEGRFHAEIDVFDLLTETAFESDLRLPPPLRRAFTAVTRGDEVLLLGGISQGGKHFLWLDQVTALNARKKTWREYPPLPFKTFAPGAGVIGGRVFFLGGMNPNFEYQNTIYSFTPGSPGGWVNTGRYLRARKGFPQALSLNARSLGILGGHGYAVTPEGKISDAPVADFEVLELSPSI